MKGKVRFYAKLIAFFHNLKFKDEDTETWRAFTTVAKIFELGSYRA